MSAFLLLPKYEQALQRIQELENECMNLRDFQVNANNKIAKLTADRARLILEVNLTIAALRANINGISGD